MKSILNQEASIFHKSDYKNNESFISEVMMYQDFELLNFVFENTTATLRKEQIVELQVKNKEWTEGIEYLQSQIINLKNTKI